MPEIFTAPIKRTSHYDALGVSADASESEIKRAYRKLAFAHHPDKNPGNVQSATKKFTEVKEAYEVLSDPEQRRKYDKEIGRYGLKSSSSFPTYETPAPKRHQYSYTFDGAPNRSASKSRESYPPSSRRSSSNPRDPFDTVPTAHVRRSSSRSRRDPPDAPPLTPPSPRTRRSSSKPRGDASPTTPPPYIGRSPSRSRGDSPFDTSPRTPPPHIRCSPSKPRGDAAFDASPTTPPAYIRRSSSKPRSDPFDTPRGSSRPRADTYDGTPLRSSSSKSRDHFGVLNAHASSKRRDSIDTTPARRSRRQDTEQILLDPEFDRSRYAAAERAKVLWERRQKEMEEMVQAERRRTEAHLAELRENMERRENLRLEVEKREAQWREEEARRHSLKPGLEKRQTKREARQRELERKDAEQRQEEWRESVRKAAERKEAEKIDLEKGENDRRQQIIQSIMKVQDMISEYGMGNPAKSKSWARYRTEDELKSYLKLQCAILVEILQERS
ncbi:unnamed protein product [Tuber aestivum]|uniref:J domain-containing protein n=1 Tax=Tuber aestivum TaxID=59557 RepID=A0A292PVY9_9PEZI|nr:unnamed protein product [Tuber aestivum]